MTLYKKPVFSLTKIRDNTTKIYFISTDNVFSGVARCRKVEGHNFFPQKGKAKKKKKKKKKKNRKKRRVGEV